MKAMLKSMTVVMITGTLFFILHSFAFGAMAEHRDAGYPTGGKEEDVANATWNQAQVELANADLNAEKTYTVGNDKITYVKTNAGVTIKQGSITISSSSGRARVSSSSGEVDIAALLDEVLNSATDVKVAMGQLEPLISSLVASPDKGLAHLVSRNAAGLEGVVVSYNDKGKSSAALETAQAVVPSGQVYVLDVPEGVTPEQVGESLGLKVTPVIVGQGEPTQLFLAGKGNLNYGNVILFVQGQAALNAAIAAGFQKAIMGNSPVDEKAVRGWVNRLVTFK